MPICICTHEGKKRKEEPKGYYNVMKSEANLKQSAGNYIITRLKVVRSMA